MSFIQKERGVLTSPRDRRQSALKTQKKRRLNTFPYVTYIEFSIR